MDLLVIGIDGGTKKIIEGMPMPYCQKLFLSAGSRTLNEDLFSRGWAEILTGFHAVQTKAFYLMPFADKTYRFNRSYSKTVMAKESPGPLLWNRLNEMGVKTGIVNVPTTGPVDEVDGFFIAGGGGGVTPGDDLPKGMYYPNVCADIIKKNEYTFDIRLPGDSKTVPEFIEKITNAELRQEKTFTDLALTENPDFGFHCYRITTEIQYLCRYEIERCIEGLASAKAKGVDFIPENSVQKSLLKHYQAIDNSIQRLFEKVKPKNFLFVGDHSTVLFEKEGNLDAWLLKNGYMVQQGFWEIVQRKVRALMIKAGLIKFDGPPMRQPLTRFSKKRTKLFGTFYEIGNCAGFFVNDSKRFGGPVKSSEAEDLLVNEVCDAFNSDPLVQKYKLSARPYRSLYKGTKNYDLMPDIMLDKPDSIYFSGRNPDFMIDNPNLKPMAEDISGIRYPYTGVKGRDPVFVFSCGLEEYVDDFGPNDMRKAYKLIESYFSSLNEN